MLTVYVRLGLTVTAVGTQITLAVKRVQILIAETVGREESA